VMEFVAGTVFRGGAMPGLEPAQRAVAYEHANNVIADLHCVDPATVGLAHFGKAEAYFERMLARWTLQYRASQTGAIPAMERLIQCLPAHIPAADAIDPPITLIHGDYRVENLVCAPDGSKVRAVLDWELSTLGHPLSDLAYHCMAWHNPPGLLG